MKRSTRALSVLLLLVMLLSLLPTVAFADGAEDNEGAAEELTRVEKINQMGYNFPAEGDTAIPKYKVILPDGTEEIRYVATDLHDDSRDLPSGSVVVLLSDIYQSTSYLTKLHTPLSEEEAVSPEFADRADDFVGFGVTNERTLSIDFAGHVIFTEYKQTFFSVTGAANLNVYSSLPGAKLICLEEDDTAGGAVITVNSGVANIGDYGEYPGSNLSTYTAGGFVLGSGATLNVKGIDAYRVATDYVSYFGISGHNSVANYENSRFFGVGRYLQIACREDPKGGGEGSTYGNVITFQDCTISNIGSPGVVTGHFFRYMADDNEVYFNNTVFDTVQFTCERYYEHEGCTDIDGNPLRANKTAVVAFDKYCSFNQVPDVNTLTNKGDMSSKFAMFKFPELAPTYGEYGSKVPEYILSDGRITDVNSMVINTEDLTANGIFNFAMQDLLDGYDLAGMYTLPFVGYEDEVVEVTWDYQGKTSDTELWIKGDTPTPYSMQVPNDTEYIRYKTEVIYEVDNIAYYKVTPEVNVTLKANFTLSDKIYMNVYIPTYEDLGLKDLVFRLSVAGTVHKVGTIAADCEVVEIGGVSYYKVVTPIEYNRVTDQITVTLEIPNRGKTASAHSIMKRVNFCDVMEDCLDGNENAEYKKAIEDVVCFIHKKTDNPTGTKKISELATSRFAARLEAEKKAEEAANKNSGGFLEGILGKFS